MVAAISELHEDVRWSIAAHALSAADAIDRRYDGDCLRGLVDALHGISNLESHRRVAEVPLILPLLDFERQHTYSDERRPRNQKPGKQGNQNATGQGRMQEDFHGTRM